MIAPEREVRHMFCAGGGARPFIMIDGNEGAKRWCILRTSGGRTLALAASLSEAGIESWTPRRTIKRPARGQHRRLHMGQRVAMIEIDVPILHEFVFADAASLHALVRLTERDASFSILHVGLSVPLVKDAALDTLRAEEARAAADTAARRECEARDAERRARADRLKTEKARRKALRSERKDFAPGTRVAVEGVPSLAGMVGTIIKGRGATASTPSRVPS